MSPGIIDMSMRHTCRQPPAYVFDFIEKHYQLCRDDFDARKRFARYNGISLPGFISRLQQSSIILREADERRRAGDRLRIGVMSCA